MKFKVKFRELVSMQVEVEADSKEEAIELVLSGEFAGEEIVERETYDDGQDMDVEEIS